MDLRRRSVLASVGTSLAIAGCLGDDDDPGADDDTDDGLDEDGDMDDGDDMDDDGQPSDVTVQVREHDEHGDILVDADGMTLYMFDADEQGQGASACYEDCEANWPPLTVDDDPTAGDGVNADLTTFDRDDGSTQVAANGWPLYYWANDESAGDATGQAVEDVWWVLGPDGEPIRDGDADDGGDDMDDADDGTDGDEDTDDADDGDDGGEPAEPTVEVRTHDDLGDIFVDADGMTLYMFDSDDQGSESSSCSGGCADNWPPLTVTDDPAAGDGVNADLTTFDRDDGSTQVAANGWPLYYWANDNSAGDATGQGVNDVWWVLDPDGEPIRDDGSGDDDEDGNETSDSGDDGNDGGYY